MKNTIIITGTTCIEDVLVSTLLAGTMQRSLTLIYTHTNVSVYIDIEEQAVISIL